MGSILIIAVLVKNVLPWLKDKFELSDNEVVVNSSYNNSIVNGSYHIVNGSGVTIVNGRVITSNNAEFIEGSGHITDNISGTGNYKAANLQSQAIQMTVSGTGDATVRARGKMVGNVKETGLG